MAYVGQDITFATVFTNSSDVEADPATVRFLLREGVDGTELEWLYNAAPVAGTHYPVGANAMVKGSTGNYHVLWLARKAERHTGFWQGAGTINQTSQTTVFVRHTDVVIVDGV